MTCAMRRAPATVNRIVSLTAEAYGFGHRDALLRRSNEVRISTPRQIAMYLARQMTPCSLTEIGRSFHMHHTTVLHSIRKIARAIESDPELRAAVAELQKAIAAGIEPPHVFATPKRKAPEWAARLEAKIDRLLARVDAA